MLGSAKKPKQKQILLFVVLVLVGFFAVVTFFGNEGPLQLKKLKVSLEKARDENREIAIKNQKLTEELELLREPAYLERLIRERLHYVKPSEYILFLNETAPLETPENPVLDSTP